MPRHTHCASFSNKDALKFSNIVNFVSTFNKICM